MNMVTQDIIPATRMFCTTVKYRAPNLPLTRTIQGDISSPNAELIQLLCHIWTLELVSKASVIISGSNTRDDSNLHAIVFLSSYPFRLLHQQCSKALRRRPYVKAMHTPKSTSGTYLVLEFRGIPPVNWDRCPINVQLPHYAGPSYELRPERAFFRTLPQP